MSLQEKFAELLKGAAQLPATSRENLHRGTEDLRASGIMERALKTGDKMPAFSLPNTEGEIVSSDDLLNKGNLVVTFYRGVWCPFCNAELEALQEVYAELKAVGAELVAISPQLEKYSKQMKRKHNLEFEILSDAGNETAEAFGLKYAYPDYLIETSKNLGADLKRFNGDDSWTLPMSSRYVVNQSGFIVAADFDPDYTKRPEPSKTIADLKKLNETATVVING